MRITQGDLRSLARAVERHRIAQGAVDALVAELKSGAPAAVVAEWHRRYEVAREQESRACHTVAVHAAIVCEDAGLVPKVRA